MLEIKIMKSKEELESTNPIPVAVEMWGTKNMPETWAYMGYVPKEGFYVKMTCEETNPIRRFTQNQDPVCQDSAMELFLLLSEYGDAYMNFEMNANGAILTAYGPNRQQRTSLTDEQIETLEKSVEIGDASWSIRFKVPEALMNVVYGEVDLKEGSRFVLNFFKVYEGGEPCQYGAYADISIPLPSFHEPEYYGEAMLVR